MNDGARRTYRRFAVGFLILGGVFLVFGVVRATVAPGVLRGDPTRVALVLMAIGAGLGWTVRRRPGDDPPGTDEDPPAGDEPGAAGGDDDSIDAAAHDRPSRR